MIKNDSGTWRSRPWTFAAATLSMLVILNYLHEILSRFAAYRSLYKNHAFYVPEGIDKIGGIVLCALAVWVLRRVAWKDVVHELGLADSPLPALFFALAASSPMHHRVRADAKPHSPHRTVDHIFPDRTLSGGGRNRISRPWRACLSTRDGLALLDIGVAPNLVNRAGAHRARTKLPRDDRADATYRLGSGSVRPSSLPISETLASYQPSIPHVSL